MICESVFTYVETGLMNWGMNYYVGRNDLELAKAADTNNSIDYEIKSYSQALHEFPDTDTVYFTLD